MLGKRIINTATGAAPTPSCTTDTVQILGDTSCIAYYKMSDATDETGSYDGTPTNVNFNVAGKFGNAGEFNGSSYINTGINLNSNSASFSVWIKITDGTQETFLGVLEGNNRAYFGVRESNFHLGAGNVQEYTVSAASLLDGDWHNVIYALNGSLANYYLDGQLVDSVSYSGGGTFTLSAFIGAINNSGSVQNQTNGSIDQVRIFNRAITQEEVETLYNEVECIPTIVPTDHFEPVIWSADGTSGDIDINSVGFQPDFVWAKIRTQPYSHTLFDSVRGVGSTHMLFSDSANSESINTSNSSGNGFVSSFNVDGFTGGTGTSANSYFNLTGNDYVAWCWKAGGPDVPGTGTGAISSVSVSANQDAGFSVVKYAHSGGSGTYTHGLNSAPEVVIRKRTDSASGWVFATTVIDGSYDYLLLNTTAGKTNYAIPAPTSTVVTEGDIGTYISYNFHSVDGYSKIGSYVGTGANGNSIVTGFRPAFVMIKCTTTTQGWSISDNKRSPNNPVDEYLEPHSSGAEQSGQVWYNIDYLSNGFTVNGSDNYTNGSGETYIFMAFAEENVQPEPVLANSFNVVTYTGNGGTQAIDTVGFQPDLVWMKDRDTTNYEHVIFDSVRGTGTSHILSSDLHLQEGWSTNGSLTSFDSNGFTLPNTVLNNANGHNNVAWCWKASNDSTINQDGSITSIVSANPAAGFSVVKWTNTVSESSVGHGLSAKPELIIAKNLDVPFDWLVYTDVIDGSLDYLTLNTTAAKGDSGRTLPTSSVFYLAGNTNDYIAYCFHSVDGYQKVGSYTGQTSGVTVETGFEPRFILIKSSSNAESWIILDTERGSGRALSPNLSNAEFVQAGYTFTTSSTGFSLPHQDTADATVNQNGYTYIYLAIA